MNDTTIQARNHLNDCQARYDKLLVDATNLAAEELEIRKTIDSLLNTDKTTEYQMASENLTSIRSKVNHVRQSTGLSLSALNESNRAYIAALNERTRERQLQLIAKAKQSLPAELAVLQAAAQAVLVSISLRDGIPVEQLNLERVLSTKMARYKTVFSDHKEQLLKALEVDSWIL